MKNYKNLGQTSLFVLFFINIIIINKFEKKYYYYRRFISIIKFEINIISIKKYRFDLKDKINY